MKLTAEQMTALSVTLQTPTGDLVLRVNQQEYYRYRLQLLKFFAIGAGDQVIALMISRTILLRPQPQIFLALRPT